MVPHLQRGGDRSYQQPKRRRTCRSQLEHAQGSLFLVFCQLRRWVAREWNGVIGSEETLHFLLYDHVHPSEHVTKILKNED
jgi:hypothetical protein